MESFLVRRFVSAAGLHGRALLRTRTPKVIRQQAVKSLLASIKMIRTKRLKQPQAIFRPGFKDGLQDSIRIESRSIRYLGPRTCSIFRNWTPVLPEKVIGCALGDGTRRTRSRQYVFRATSLGDESREDDMHKDFSIHFNHGRFVLQLPRTVAVGTRQSVSSPSRVVAIVYDDLLLRTHLKGPQPSMGTIHPKYSTDSRNVSIEPRQQWLLHCRNTRSPKNRAEKKREHDERDSDVARTGTTPHS